MTTLLVTIAILAVVYVAAIYWLVFGRGEFRFVDNAFVAWVLVNFMGRMQCITIGARCYGYASGWQNELTPERRKHEEFHYTNQWRVMPYTFLPRYLIDLALHGYEKSVYENAARQAAGEPTR